MRMDEATAGHLVNQPERKAASFGNRLRREREERGISLDDVSISTKISLRMLRALEEEKFEQLPGGIFNKGFVRAYARHLGIDEEQAVADYLEAVGEATAPQLPEPVIETLAPPPKPERHPTSTEVPWGLLAVLLLVSALGLSFWSHRTRAANTNAATADVTPTLPPPSPSATVKGEVPIAPVAPAPNSTAAKNVSSQIDLAGQRSIGFEGAGIVGPAASTPKKPALPEDPSSGNKPAALQNPSPAHVSPTPVPPAANFVVLIEAEEENCRVTITADGKTILDGTLIAPAVKAVKAQKQIVVKVGNAGALSFSFNGRKLGAQGNPGEIKTLVFSPSGLAGSGAPAS